MQTVMIPMRDGVRLATDIHLPEGTAPFPVIIMRSTYGRVLEDVRRWTEEGYALVIQDVRGTGESEGEFEAFAPDGWGPDHTDGADTAAWIKKQSFCGKLGSYGGSALGITQVRLAGSTALCEAQSIRVAASGFYDGLSYQGGVWRKELCEGWLALFGAGGKNTERIWKSHPCCDAFWDFYDADSAVFPENCPAIHFGGWWDIFQTGTLRHFKARHGQGGAGNRQILVMKNCHHGDQSVADYTFMQNQNDLRLSRIEKACFAAWLKGDTDAVLPEHDVHYYVIGDDQDPHAPGNEWRTADDWPPYPTRETQLYLGADGMLTPSHAETRSGGRSFIYDPRNPLPTLGGPNLCIPAGPHDQRRVDLGLTDFFLQYETFGLPEGWRKLMQEPPVPRTDILKFESAPLQDPLEIAGPVRVRLCVSTDAADADFHARLVDIYPEEDGREILLLDGIMRLRYRNGFRHACAPLRGGETATLEIDLWQTSAVFNTGHRIGLRISGGSYPRFEINPANGDDFPSDRPMFVSRSTVFCGGENPSALILPVKA